MSGIFFVKQLPIEYFDTRFVGYRLLNVLNRYNKKIMADYLRTIKTWDHKPVFHSYVAYQGARPRLAIWTDDSIYYDVDNGTDVRYDVMTWPFEPKTKAGVLDSFPGVGGYSYTDTKNPRSGIEPRNFSGTITKLYYEPFLADLEKALAAGVEARTRRYGG
jgi:hypothetical protein